MAKKSNIRHNIEPRLVAEQISKAVDEEMRSSVVRSAYAEKLQAQYQQDVEDGTVGKRWSRQPDSPDWVRKFHSKQADYQKSYYSLVRVIELPKKGKRFVLVYGEVDDATVTIGTGPFASFHEAADCFLKGGR